MATTEAAPMVPITREFLRAFYKDWPIDDLPEEVEASLTSMRGLCDDLKVWDAVDASKLSVAPPKHMDRNVYFNRWQCEEVADKAKLIKQTGLDFTDELDTVVAQCLTIADRFESYQRYQSDEVNKLVSEFLPNDMRTRFLHKARERKEQKNQAAIDALMLQGGSISDKYDLLWKQQWERRQSLADLGAATGIYKTLIKFLSGCPEALLDFAKQINAPLGPTEEIRIKYGPHLYKLTEFINQTHLLACCILAAAKAGRTKSQLESDVAALGKSVEIYQRESSKYLSFMTEVVSKSPFFVTAEEIAQSMATTQIKEDPFEEITLSRTQPFEKKVILEEDRSSLLWQYTLNRDVQFTVKTAAGVVVHGPEQVPSRGEMVEGLLNELQKGSYTVLWETAKASVWRKTSTTISYRVAVMQEESDAESQEWSTELQKRNSSKAHLPVMGR